MNEAVGREGAAVRTVSRGIGEPGVQCPKCGGEMSVRLDRVDAQANTCFRCRPCGHIFSPKFFDEDERFAEQAPR